MLTGSLGILAEAAHSGLDLAAAAITLFAVRISGRPADQEHTYGHGKVENLSALFETLLLLVTCLWIIYEAIHRLAANDTQIEMSVWGFVVMGISIIIDFTRSRVLARTAKKYDSQALEADALHFSTDIWSSAVVIVGLGLVFVARQLRLEWLGHADAVAALGVAIIVVYVSLQLGKRTIQGLLDAVPPALIDEVQRAVRVPGVLGVRQVRVRRSGPEAFADITLAVGRAMSLEQSHSVASEAETAVRRILPGADVMVHVEPEQAKNEDILSTVRLLAARQGLGVHSIRYLDAMGTCWLEMHLEVNSALRLDAAHAQATAFEKALREALPQIDRIVTHIEPAGTAARAHQAAPADEALILNAVKGVERELHLDVHPHEIIVNRNGGELVTSFHCRLDPEAPITDAHAITEQVEVGLRRRVPELGRVVIHVEPFDERENDPNED